MTAALASLPCQPALPNTPHQAQPAAATAAAATLPSPWHQPGSAGQLLASPRVRGSVHVWAAHPWGCRHAGKRPPPLSSSHTHGFTRPASHQAPGQLPCRPHLHQPRAQARWPPSVGGHPRHWPPDPPGQLQVLGHCGSTKAGGGQAQWPCILHCLVTAGRCSAAASNAAGSWCCRRGLRCMHTCSLGSQQRWAAAAARSLQACIRGRRCQQQAGKAAVPLTDGHALGVDGAQVGVLKQVHHEVLRGLTGWGGGVGVRGGKGRTQVGSGGSQGQCLLSVLRDTSGGSVQQRPACRQAAGRWHWRHHPHHQQQQACSPLQAVLTSCSASMDSAVHLKGSGATWLPISLTWWQQQQEVAEG
jgi:hypothetical protein